MPDLWNPGLANRQGLTVDRIIKTHVHADHLITPPYILQKLGGKIGVGEKNIVVQDTFGKVFNEGAEFQRDGSLFDALFRDGDGNPMLKVPVNSL